MFQAFLIGARIGIMVWSAVKTVEFLTDDAPKLIQQGKELIDTKLFK